MSEYKAGDRVKIFCKANGGHLLGTIAKNVVYKIDSEGATREGDSSLVVIADRYSDDPWYIDTFRLEKFTDKGEENE